MRVATKAPSAAGARAQGRKMTPTEIAAAYKESKATIKELTAENASLKESGEAKDIEIETVKASHAEEIISHTDLRMKMESDLKAQLTSLQVRM